MTQQIQRNLFPRQQDIGKSAGARNNLAGVHFLAISRKGFQLLLRIERHENFFSRFQSGDHHLLSRYKSPLSARVAHQHTLRRNVAATEILTQKQPDARIERAFVQPVQCASPDRGHPCPLCSRSKSEQFRVTTTPPTFDSTPRSADQCQPLGTATPPLFPPAPDSQNPSCRAER